MEPQTKLGRFLVAKIAGELEEEIANIENREARYALTNVPQTTLQGIKRHVRLFYHEVDVVGDYDWGFDFQNSAGNWTCLISYSNITDKCSVIIKGLD